MYKLENLVSKSHIHGTVYPGRDPRTNEDCPARETDEIEYDSNLEIVGTTVRRTLDEVKPFVMLLVVVLITLFSIAFIVLIMKLVYPGRFSIDRFQHEP